MLCRLSTSSWFSESWYSECMEVERNSVLEEAQFENRYSIACTRHRCGDNDTLLILYNFVHQESFYHKRQKNFLPNRISSTRTKICRHHHFSIISTINWCGMEEEPSWNSKCRIPRSQNGVVPLGLSGPPSQVWEEGNLGYEPTRDLPARAPEVIWV